jgi:hypothetical protein
MNNFDHPNVTYHDNEYLDTFAYPDNSESENPNLSELTDAKRLHLWINAALDSGRERAIAYQYYVLPMSTGNPRIQEATLATYLGISLWDVRASHESLKATLKAYAAENGGCNV